MSASDIILCVLAILLPPVPVWMKRGFCSADGVISIALCVLGYFPGLVHAIYIVLKYPEERTSDDIESGARHHGLGGLQGYQQVSQQFPQQQNEVYAPVTAGPASSYGAIGNEQRADAGKAPLPSYAEVVKGPGATRDNKIQL